MHIGLFNLFNTDSHLFCRGVWKDRLTRDGTLNPVVLARRVNITNALHPTLPDVPQVSAESKVVYYNHIITILIPYHTTTALLPYCNHNRVKSRL